MSNLRITRPPAPVAWTLARHYHAGSPEKQGSCIGLPRVNDWPDLPAEPRFTSAYRGVKRVVKAERVHFEAWVCHSGGTHYAGVSDSEDGAARLYDAYCEARNLGKTLNFGAEERAG